MAATILIEITAALHIYFLILEMFLWTGPIGQKTFKMTNQKAEETKTLAANQGLYNGFLAAGLIWSRFYENLLASYHIAIFFLICILLAAAYGAYTVNKKYYSYKAYRQQFH